MASKAHHSSVMNTYMRQPVAFERGEGVWLYDDLGNRYLDALSGIAVCTLGHCHPAVTQAIQYQAGKLIHTSNLYHIQQQEALAKKLCALTQMESVFFGNSGAEANECAIKLARLHGNKQNIENPQIIVFDNAFHGRTLATLSATASRKVQAGFEPLVSGFVRAPFNDIAAIETIAKNTSTVVAVLVEPIQGEGGIHIPSNDFLQALRRICDDNNWLMMLDEVQSGNGRTGTYFNYQQSNILPDVVTTAKGLGNGFPIGACLVQGKAANLFGPGNHGSTYGGSPLACATALAVLETLEKEDLYNNASAMGSRILSGFKQRLGDEAYILDIRGKGLMIAVELDRSCTELVALALGKGLLINVTADRVIRLLPPLIISAQEADLLVDGLAKLIKTYVGDDRQQTRAARH